MQPYELSEADFVAGTYKVFKMYPKNKENEPADLSNAKMYFSVSDYVNGGTPIISKSGKIIEGTTAYAEITSSESATLQGKYIYQFTVIDNLGPVYCAKGLMTVWPNIDAEVLEQ